MDGKISVVKLFGAESDSPLHGEWRYTDGVMTKGRLKKITIDLRQELEEVSEPEELLHTLATAKEADKLGEKTATYSGMNLAMYLVGEAIAEKKMKDRVTFLSIFKDTSTVAALEKGSNHKPALWFSTDLNVYNHICSIPGVELSAGDLAHTSEPDETGTTSDKLKQLKSLLDDGLITEQDYAKKKDDLLDRF